MNDGFGVAQQKKPLEILFHSSRNGFPNRMINKTESLNWPALIELSNLRLKYSPASH